MFYKSLQLFSIALFLAHCGAPASNPSSPGDASIADAPAEAADVAVTLDATNDGSADNGTALDGTAFDGTALDVPRTDVGSEVAAPEAAMCGGDCGPHGHSHGDHCHCDPGYIERDRCCVPAPPCSMPDDRLEENDDQSNATPVAPMGSSWEGLRVCPADADVFRIPLMTGQRVTARATFTHARGDIDLYLFGPRTTDLSHSRPAASSDGTRDNELITYTARASGNHWLLVTGHNGAENTYNLAIEIAGP